MYRYRFQVQNLKTMQNTKPTPAVFRTDVFEDKVVIFAQELYQSLKSKETFRMWWEEKIRSGFIDPMEYFPCTVQWDKGPLVQDYCLTISSAARICALENTEVAKSIMKTIIVIPEQELLREFREEAEEDYSAPAAEELSTLV